MAGKKAPAAAPAAAPASLDISSLFEQELQARNEDLRRQAALNMFYKLHPTNKMTVDQFINGLRQHKDVWGVVSGMGVVDFAEALSGGSKRTVEKAASKPARRTRLNESQKNNLKAVILKTLSENKDGLNRNEIAKAVTNEQLSTIGIDRAELANKLRQPLSELVGDSRIHTVGEKRLMKYLSGGAPRKK
jgi:hypothetical protein